MLRKIFVYGTLKKSQPNHYIITESAGKCKYLGCAETTGFWPLVVAGPYNIPYLLEADGRGMHVRGEVYEVDDITLSMLDSLERHPLWYTRMPIEVQMLAGSDDQPLRDRPAPEVVEAYLLQKPNKSLLKLVMYENYDCRESGQSGYVRPQSREDGVWGLSDVKEVD